MKDKNLCNRVIKEWTMKDNVTLRMVETNYGYNNSKFVIEEADEDNMGDISWRQVHKISLNESMKNNDSNIVWSLCCALRDTFSDPVKEVKERE